MGRLEKQNSRSRFAGELAARLEGEKLINLADIYHGPQLNGGSRGQ